MALSVVLAVVGSSLIAKGIAAPPHAPALAHNLGVIPDPVATGALVATPSVKAVAPPLTLPASTPLSVTIPAIAVTSKLTFLNRNPDGTIQVPSRFYEAGWYQQGPTPGQLGPSVILGHVDSYKGPGIFFRLASLKPGDMVNVARLDGTTATFKVNAVNEYDKAQFPSQAIYGDIGYAGLRLITCGGIFDHATGSYLSNIVVFASLVTKRPLSEVTPTRPDGHRDTTQS